MSRGTVLPMNAKAYSYVRFSTPEQAKGDSRRRQTDLAARYVEFNGLTLDTELNLSDLGVSAFRGSNELAALGGFRKAIEDGIVEPGSVLLVESLDRISRKVARKAVRILEEIVEAGVDVVTLNDSKRYSAESLDGMDFLMAFVILMRGHEESATKSKRVGQAWSNKRNRTAAAGYGRTYDILSRSVPGWIDAHDGVAKLVPERAAIVCRIFSEFIAGRGKSAIARSLNTDRVPTFGTAKQWHPSYIQKMLRSETVTGTMTPHVETYAGGKLVRTPQTPILNYYPAVIDPETWAAAQAIQSTDRYKKQTSRPVQNILAGLARCPKCGGTMTRVYKGDAIKAGPPKLVCVSGKAGAGCTYRSVSLDAIETAFARHADMPWPNADASLEADIRDLDAAQDGVLGRIENILAAMGDGSPGKHAAATLAGLEADAERIAAKLAAAQAKAAQADTKVMQIRAAKLKRVLSDAPLDAAAANAVLREVLTAVTVDYDASSLRLVWRHDGVTEIPYGNFE